MSIELKKKRTRADRAADLAMFIGALLLGIAMLGQDPTFSKALLVGAIGGVVLSIIGFGVRRALGERADVPME